MGAQSFGSVTASLLNQKKEKKKKPEIPGQPEGAVARTQARKRAAEESQARRGRQSTILSDTLG